VLCRHAGPFLGVGQRTTVQIGLKINEATTAPGTVSFHDPTANPPDLVGDANSANNSAAVVVIVPAGGAGGGGGLPVTGDKTGLAVIGGAILLGAGACSSCPAVAAR
jgi:hypothetical protein